MNINHTLFLTLLMVLLFSSCDIYEQDEYTEQVVLESYMIAGRPLPVVRLSKTLPADVEYSFGEAALTDAEVIITKLENGSPAEEFPYQTQANGVYRPANRIHRVEPGSRYRIDVQFNNRDEVLRAETITPEQFDILNDVENEYVYQSENQLEILLSATESSARQNVYVFNTLAREPSLENLTPFYLDAVEEGDSDISEFLNNSSGLINEGNFDIKEDRTILLRFPWIGVAFFGENAVVTNSVDQNLADLVRSEELQLGGSTLPPGEIPNLIYNVEGGIGVFGSISSDTLITRFVRPDSLRQ
ncbi:MAG: DUF4249 family protein [Balneolaceae bacterium]